MNYEFMTAGTPLPLCLPFPEALVKLPVSGTAKIMYCRMLDAMLTRGMEDENGILFVYFPVKQLAAALSRCNMTVKRSLNELENVGLIMRVRQQGFGEPNRIYVLIPKKGIEEASSGAGGFAGRGRQPRPVGVLLATLRIGYYLTQNPADLAAKQPFCREKHGRKEKNEAD